MPRIIYLSLALILYLNSNGQSYPFSYDNMRYGSILITDSNRNNQLFRPEKGEIFYGKNALELVRDGKNYVLFENSYYPNGLLKKTSYYDQNKRVLETVNFGYNKGKWLTDVSWHIIEDGRWRVRRATCYDYVFSYKMNSSTMSFESGRMPVQITVTNENCSAEAGKEFNTELIYGDIVWFSDDLHQLESYTFKEIEPDGQRVLRNQYVKFNYSDSGYIQTVYNIANDTQKVPLEQMYVRKGRSGELLFKRVKYYNHTLDTFITYQTYYFVQTGPSLNLMNEVAYIKNSNGTNKFRPAVRYVYQEFSDLSNTGTRTDNNTLNIFPQMAGDLLNIRIPEIDIRIGQIQILNIQGRTIGQFFIENEEAGNTKEVDISEYPNGTYIVVFSSGKTIYTGKFIKGE